MKLCIFIDKHVTLICVKSYKCTAYNKEDISVGICVTLIVHMYCATDLLYKCQICWKIQSCLAIQRKNGHFPYKFIHDNICLNLYLK